MELTCIVNPLSSSDIELDAAQFLARYQPDVLYGDKIPLDVYKLFDDIFLDKGTCLQIVNDEDMPNEILGAAEMDTNIIKIRQTDYDKCATKGYQRMTASHEVGHPRLQLLQFQKNNMTMYRIQSNKIPPYMSAEWQARVWASAVLMPFPAMIRLLNNMDAKTPENLIAAIMDRFIVTRSAAKARLETIKQYNNDGRNRFSKILEEMKIKGFM